jgi:hypothetical protein
MAKCIVMIRAIKLLMPIFIKKVTIENLSVIERSIDVGKLGNKTLLFGITLLRLPLLNIWQFKKWLNV